MSHEFKVKKSERGKPLEAFLYEKFGDWSHKQIKNAINAKQVFVNSKQVFIASWNLKPNDRVTVVEAKTPKSLTPQLARYHYVQVLYEDDALLVTNKPAFVDYDSFVAYVNEYLKRMQPKKNFFPYVGQMHRLDKETSGILIFTKKKSANILAEQFRNRQIQKFYLAMVWGLMPKQHGMIRERLEKLHTAAGRKVQVAKKGEGKESLTEYWVTERYNDASLLRVRLGTGRTHQIRVHLSEMGFPLIGDKLYGLQNPPIALKLKRQALHAHEIIFRHPINSKKIHITAPIPDDLKLAIDTLRVSV